MTARPRQAKVGSKADNLRAVADCNAMLAALGEVWAAANAALNGPHAPRELANALVQVRAAADAAVRKVMTPGH